MGLSLMFLQQSINIHIQIVNDVYLSNLKTLRKPVTHVGVSEERCLLLYVDQSAQAASQSLNCKCQSMALAHTAAPLMWRDVHYYTIHRQSHYV